MTRLAIAGLAHPHVTYALDELPHWPEVSLVAVAEGDPSLLERYAESLEGVPTFETLPELLADQQVDVVVIVGIYAERAADVVAALDAGARVLADKPLCTDLEQLNDIRVALKRGGGELSVVFEKRMYPTTIALRKIIDEGTLGRVTLIATTGPHKLNYGQRPPWFFERDGYGGIAGDLPVHDIDMALWLTGAQEGLVSAISGNGRLPQHPTFEDHVAVLLRVGEVAATLEAHWMTPEAADVHGHYRMRVTGTEGTAEVDWAYNTLTVATHDQPPHQVELGAGQRPAQYFFEALAAGTPPAIGTADSLLATEIALLAQASADHDGEPRSWTAGTEGA